MTQAYLEPAGDPRSEVLQLSGDRVRIGATRDSDTIVNNQTVSRRHAVLRREGAAWIIEDDRSTNGTWVNRRGIARPTNIADGDLIAFGTARFFFREGRSKSQNSRSFSSTKLPSDRGNTARSILEQILILKPHEFEKLIQRLFARLSFDSVVTQQSKDGGVDVRAVNKGVIYGGKYSIQCKRYTKKNVSRPEMNAFFGVIMHERTKGIFVTTTSFSKGAKEFAERNGINLIDGKTLEALIRRHRVI